MGKTKLAVTIGDPAGIGPEIAVKALSSPAIYQEGTPILVGDLSAIREALRQTGLPLNVHVIASPADATGEAGTIDLLDLSLLPAGGWQYGRVAKETGEASFRYVERAIQLAMAGEVDAVVTGPISKEALHLAGHPYAGHTEIFADLTGTRDFAMLLASDNLRVIHVTTHVSLRNACDLITAERVLKVIGLADYSMRLLDIARPRVAVAGLNPHSSENGLFGGEEAEAIEPAIAKARAEGIDVAGPVPPDTVFVKAVGGQYDVVVAMYHDQGHIPLKLLGFRMEPGTDTFTAVSGINCTIGLPFMRTSVDHGTAFDRAGQNTANAQSMLEAIDAALTMTRNMHGEARTGTGGLK